MARGAQKEMSSKESENFEKNLKNVVNMTSDYMNKMARGEDVHNIKDIEFPPNCTIELRDNPEILILVIQYYLQLKGKK